MRRTVSKTMASVERALPTQYLTPIALLLTMSFACLFGLLLHLTALQDRLQESRDIELVENVARSAARLADHDLRDYAVWNEAVVHLVDRFEHDWAATNLGPYLVHSQGYDLMAVADQSGRPLYLETSSVTPRYDRFLDLGPAFARSLRQVHHRPHNDPLIAGYSRAGNVIYLFAVSKIQPLTAALAKPGAPSRAMIVARRIDPAYLQAISEDPTHPNFRLELTRNDQFTQVPLRAPSGEILAYLSWSPQRPGSLLRRQMFPAFLLISLITVLRWRASLFGAAGSRWRR